MEIRALAFDLAQAVLRLHELEELHQKETGTRTLLEAAGKALLLVTRNGVVARYTPPGREILLTVIHGTRRPNGAATIPTLPDQILTMLPTISDRTQVAISKTASAVITPLPCTLTSTVQPSFIIELFLEEEANSNALLPQHLDRLSQREREILQLLLRGKRDKEIAAMCSISLGTTRNHVSTIYHKLECAGRPQLLTIATGTFTDHVVPALGSIEGFKFNSDIAGGKLPNH
jgi:DNA-binding CsgD family transcriptional regulator